MNLEIELLQSGPIRANTYLFSCGDGTVVIDPAVEAHKIFAATEKTGKPIRTVLLTHAHYDHVGSVKILQDSGATVYLHRADMAILPHAYLHNVPKFLPDVLLEGGEILNFGGTSVEVIHAPGHTAGSVCYRVLDNLFSGDTLFVGDVGRCDLPSGCFNTLKASLGKLFATAQDLHVLPGHGASTTLAWERLHNPYVFDSN